MKRLLLLFLLFTFWTVAPVQAQENEIVMLEIEGPVTQAMADYFNRGVAEAESRGATAILIILNTPGGSVTTTLAIVQTFRNADIPVIIYISPNGAQAASAGSVITAASHAAGMAPETVIGAASPINSDGSDINETAYRKAVEDLKATMRSLTEDRGEEAVTLAEAMIEDARAVSANEALDAGFIDVVASDTDSLLEQLDGLQVTVNDNAVTLETADASVRPLDMSFIERLLLVLANPFLIGILLTIGVQAILIEMSNPGGWIAGLIGVLCLALALYGAGQLPVNWLGMGLVLLAFILFVMEAFTPTSGALSVAGALTLIAGFLILFNSPGTPEFARISISGAVGLSLFSASFFIFIVTKALGAQRVQPVTGVEGLLGQAGPVRTPLEKIDEGGPYIGRVLVNGELWRAASSEAIDKGDEIEVTAVEGFTLQVKKRYE